MNKVKKELTPLRTVVGIPMINNMVSDFNGKQFALSRYAGPVNNIEIQSEFARPCNENVSANIEHCQYDKRNGFVKSKIVLDDGDYTMLINENDNRVFIYKSFEYDTGAAISSIGIKTMEIPDEAVIDPFGNDNIVYALETINAMIEMNEDDAFRLIHREYEKYVIRRDRGYFVMKILRSPEFISALGASCWIRKGKIRGTTDCTEFDFVKLADEGISSTDELNGLQMTCIRVEEDYLLLSSWTGASAVWLKGDAAFVKINPDNFIFTGEPEVDIPYKSNITLKNASLKMPLKLSSNPTVTVDGECSITVGYNNSCIRCEGEILIKGHGSLTLVCKSHSSAIGYGGRSQSYGRYVPYDNVNPVTKVIIDGVHLEVETGTPNFSIGSYGLDNDVEVVLLNGGTVSGVPEAIGKVKLESVGITSEGSTKIDGSAVYSLIPMYAGISADPYAAPGGELP